MAPTATIAKITCDCADPVALAQSAATRIKGTPEMAITTDTSPRIVVPLDGSALAETALPLAAKVAADRKTQVILLRVIAPPSQVPSELAADLGPLVDLAERRAAEALRTYASSFPGRLVVPVVLVGAHPAAAIIEWLRDHPVDAVIMATHGRRPLWRWLVGSVSETVRRNGLAPVIVVSPRRRQPRADAGVQGGRPGQGEPLPGEWPGTPLLSGASDK